MSMNVFAMDKSVRHYYLKHPLKAIQVFFRHCKYAYQRIVKGYCNEDLWDIDWWILNIMPPMLREFAERTHTYPGKEPFETEEAWRDWLLELARDFEDAQEEWPETRNEYEDEYMRALKAKRRKDPTSTYTDEDIEELKQMWSAANKRLNKQYQEHLDKTFAKFAQYIRWLWD